MVIKKVFAACQTATNKSRELGRQITSKLVDKIAKWGEALKLQSQLESFPLNLFMLEVDSIRDYFVELHQWPIFVNFSISPPNIIFVLEWCLTRAGWRWLSCRWLPFVEVRRIASSWRTFRDEHRRGEAKTFRTRRLLKVIDCQPACFDKLFRLSLAFRKKNFAQHNSTKDYEVGEVHGWLSQREPKWAVELLVSTLISGAMKRLALKLPASTVLLAA